MTTDALTLVGVVTDPAGHPVAGARVVLAAGPVPVPDIALLTDAEGRFSLGVPAVGRYRVEAFSDTGSAAEPVTVESGHPAAVRLVLR